MDRGRRYHSGGIIGLHRLCRDHGPALEASLQAVYQVDYRDLWRCGPNRLTFRRLAVLVRYLPPDCALAVELRGRPHWGLAEHLLDTIRMTLTGSEKRPATPWPGRFDPVDRTPKRDMSAALEAGERRRIERERRLQVRTGGN